MLKTLVFLLIFFTGLTAADIEGFWKTIDEKSGNPRCVVAIYEHNGMYFGRIIGTYDDEGKMKETIYAPKEQAPGIVGNPYFCGLDLIWNLEMQGASFKGKIVDPEKGNIYNAEVWTQKGALVVRGKLLFFGRNQEWLPATKTDFPKDFKLPDVKKFVPVIPKVN